MIEKPDWIKRGVNVLALGIKGVVTRFQQNTVNSKKYVYYINVRLDGEKHSRTYHPTDVVCAVEG